MGCSLNESPKVHVLEQFPDPLANTLRGAAECAWYVHAAHALNFRPRLGSQFSGRVASVLVFQAPLFYLTVAAKHRIRNPVNFIVTTTV